MPPRNENDRILRSCFSIPGNVDLTHDSYNWFFCFPGTLSLKVVAARLDVQALVLWHSECWIPTSHGWFHRRSSSSNATRDGGPQQQQYCVSNWFNPAELHPKPNLTLHLGFLQDMEAELAKLDLELQTQALAGDLWWILHRPWVAWEADTIPAELPETPTSIEAWEITTFQAFAVFKTTYDNLDKADFWQTWS